MIIIFVLQISIAGLAHIYETEIDDELTHTLNETFRESYGVDERRTIAIDAMQQNVSQWYLLK